MYKITFTSKRGHLIAEKVSLNKSRKTYKITLGTCECYRNICRNCEEFFIFPADFIASIEKIETRKEEVLNG